MKQYNRQSEIANTRIELRKEEEASEIAEHIFEIEDYKARVRNYMERYTSSELLDMFGYGTDDEALQEAYWRKYEKEHAEWAEIEKPKLWAYYEEHKNEPKYNGESCTWWDFFSDWHKDVYGFRPHHV